MCAQLHGLSITPLTALHVARHCCPDRFGQLVSFPHGTPPGRISSIRCGYSRITLWTFHSLTIFEILIVRKTTTIMTAAGIAMTVAVLLAVLGLSLRTANMLSLRQAIRCTCWCCAKAGTAELTSLLTQEQFHIIKNFPRNRERITTASLCASLEVVTIINMPSPDNPDGSNVTLRGLSPAGVAMRKLKIVTGRWFRPGRARDRRR